MTIDCETHDIAVIEAGRLERRVAELEAMVARYENFIQAVRLADALLRDGHADEGIAQVKATMDHYNAHG